jgi:hypothetical protein
METPRRQIRRLWKKPSPVIPRPLCGRGIALCPGLSGLQGGIPRCARNDKRGYGITTMAALYQGTALAVPLRRGKIFFGAGSSARLKPGPDTMPAKNAARLRAGFLAALGMTKVRRRLGAGFLVARGSSEWRLKADSHGALRMASGWCADVPREAIAGSKPRRSQSAAAAGATAERARQAGGASIYA